MPLFHFALSNGREITVQGPTQEDASIRASAAYPDEMIVGVRVEADPVEEQDEDTVTTDTTGEDE